MALGLIALYFALQSAAGALVAFGLAWAGGWVSWSGGLDRFGSGIQAMLEQPGKPAIMVICTLAISGGLILWLIHRLWPQRWSQARPPGLGFVRPRHGGFFLLALAIGVLAPLLGGWLTQLLSQGHAVTQDIRQLGGETPMALRIALAIAVTTLGPLVEEVLFRGALLSAFLQRWRTGVAVLLSTLLFVLVHLPGMHYQWYGLPDLLLLALALSGLRLASGSIWPAVLAHAANNLLAVMAWFLASHPG